MIKARKPDITRVWHDNLFYKIEDAYPDKEMAERTAQEMRGNIFPAPGKRYYCKTVVVDLGPNAGRLRYGIFIAKGKEIGIKNKRQIETRLEKEEIEDIVLSITNDANFYRRYLRPIELNYARKKVQQTFNKTLALKGLDPLVKEGLKAYGIPSMPPTYRKKVANELLAVMMSNIIDSANEMKKLKKAGRPWTMRER